MKTLIIMPVAEQRGGAELALTHLMQERAASMEWRVAFLEDGPMVEQYRSMQLSSGEGKTGVHVVPAGQLREAGRFVRTVKRLAQIARDENVDAILSWMGKPHLYGGFAGRLAGVPALWYQHGLPSKKNVFDRLIALMPAQGILACSATAARAQLELGSRCPIEAVCPGVDLSRSSEALMTSPAETRQKLGLPADGPLIGMVGRLQRWKGMHVLIDALPTVLDRHPNAHCVIVGGEHSLEPDYSSVIRGRIEALGLEGKVTLAGLRRNAPEWMQAMDVFVHASDHEPFGMVVIEAMALGKPVIAGDAGGPTEIITNGVDGLLTPYGDSKLLAGAVLRYLGDREFARATGVAASKRAQDFSTGRYAQKVEQSVRELAEWTGARNRAADVTHA